MKITLFLSFFLFLVIQNIQAQVSVGLKIGGGINSQIRETASLDETSDPLVSVITGLFLEVPLSERFFLQPEVLFVEKGGEYNNSIKTSYNYLEIPVLLKWKFINGDFLKANFMAGPSWGYLRSSEISIGEITIPIEESENQVKGFEVGLNLGTGASVHFGRLGVFLDARYFFSAIDVSDSEDQEVKNTGVALTTGVLFRLGD